MRLILGLLLINSPRATPIFGADAKGDVTQHKHCKRMGWDGILLNRVRDVCVRFYYNLNGSRGECSATEESRIKFSDTAKNRTERGEV